MSALATRSPVSDLYQATERVIGQDPARQQMAVLMARQLSVAEGQYPRSQSAIVAGFTGVGKTYLTRMMCEACGLPFTEVNATQYTETGYAGDDLAQMFVPLLESASRLEDASRGAEPEAVASVLKREDINNVAARASTGVIFLDEFDKWTQRLNHTTGRLDTAIQAELLKMIEGSVEYVTDNEDELGIPFDTSRVLIICGGAFVGLANQVLRRLDRPSEYVNDPGFWELVEQGDFVKYGLIPELAGRLGIHIFMRPLRPEHLAEILMQPGGPIEEYRQRFEAIGVRWDVPMQAVVKLADIALRKDVGARGIDHVLWQSFSHALFAAHKAEWPAVVRLAVNQHRAVLEAV